MVIKFCRLVGVCHKKYDWFAQPDVGADRYAPADFYVEPVEKVGKQHLADDA